MRGLARTVACAGAAGILLLAGADSAAVAQDDDTPFDQKIIQGVLGTLGLRSNSGDIDYRERSPLVLPPRLDLPPPQSDTTASVRNWPADPDVKRRRGEQSRGRDEIEEARPLRPDELNVGPRQRGRAPASPDNPDGAVLSPRELGYKGGVLGSLWGNNDDKPVQFTGEPPRTSLIEPPPGYQTPSPDHPYAAKPKSVLPSVPTFFDFGTERK
jgi:hypothetical protein